MRVSLRPWYFLSSLFLGYIILLIVFKVLGLSVVLNRGFALSYLVASVIAIIISLIAIVDLDRNLDAFSFSWIFHILEINIEA